MSWGNTPAGKGMGPDEEWLAYKGTYFSCNNVKGWGRHGESCGHVYMYWCLYTFWPRCGIRWAVAGTSTWDHTGVYIFVCSYAKGWERHKGEVNMHTYTEACTPSIQGVRPDDGLPENTQTWSYKGPHNSIHLCIGDGAMWQVRWACIHVLMHVHLLVKVWNEKRSGWAMKIGMKRVTHIWGQLYKRVGAVICYICVLVYCCWENTQLLSLCLLYDVCNVMIKNILKIPSYVLIQNLYL